MENPDIIITVVATTITLFLFGALMIVLLMGFRRRHLKLQEVSKMRLEIEERTFQMISHEIHDNVGQVLSLARVQINYMNESGLLDRDMLLQVKDLIGRAMADLRDLAKGLNGERVMAYHLHETLQQECEGISRSGIIYASVAVNGGVRDIGGQRKLIVFRIVQEAIQNCIKHAQATTIVISIFYEKVGIRITVTDDGSGFDLPAVLDCSKGSGIGNIRRRAALAKATCTIESDIGKGTTVRIYVPYV